MQTFELSFSVVCILFVTLIYHTESRILRLTCKSYANFSEMWSSSVFTKKIIGDYKDLSMQECKAKCLFNPPCEAASYHTNGTCLLSSDSPTNPASAYSVRHLTEENGWIFMSTNYYEKLTGHNCINFNPCGQDYCLDICEFPGYQCIKCGSTSSFSCTKENIALFKPSRQSSTHSWQGIHLVSAFGNDGNYDGDWSVCAITKEDSSPWWQVDLRREAIIGKVSVKSGTVWEPVRIDPFYLSIGNDASDGGKNNPLCVNGGKLHKDERLFTCPTPIRGRYVSIYLTRTEFLQVCEVSAYEQKVNIERYLLP